MTWARGRENRRGVVGAWVVVALLALVGMAAFAVDLGRLVLATQRAQDVTDAAALAGALRLPDVEACEQELASIVDTNNLSAPGWSVRVDPGEDLSYYFPGQEVAGYGTLAEREYAVTVRGHMDVVYTFARMFGIEQVHVVREATGLCTASPGEGDAIVFAGETNPNRDGIRANGSNLTVEGSMHSNTKVRMNGSNQTVTGAIEYLYQFTSNGSNNDFGELVESSVQPYPVNYTWEQFDIGPWDYTHDGNLTVNASGSTLPSGRRRIDGDFRVNGSNFYLENSLIVCTGDIIFNGSNVDLNRVTLVAQGTITFNGSTERFCHFQDDLFAMSLSSASTAMKVNGSNSDTWGVLFAPNGGMVYNGSNQEIHHGALVALTIEINGSSSTFMGAGEGGEGGPNRVRLIR